MIGTNPVPGGFGIYRWDTDHWTQVPGGAVRIAVDTNGIPYVVNNQGLVFTRSGDSWWQYPANVRARDIAVSEDGSVDIVSTAPRPGGYAVYHYIPPEIASWSEIGGGGVRIGAGRAPWLVNDAGRVFTIDSRGWYALPGTARDVAASGKTAWIIGTTPVPGGYTIHRFDGVGFGQVAGGATGITVGPNGMPWIVNSFGEIFRGTPFVDQRLCPVADVPVPATAASVNAATLMPGESVAITPSTAQEYRINPGVVFSGWSGPEGWNFTAPAGFPLPGARQYSLLMSMASGWQYLGAAPKTVQNRTGDPQPLRFRINDNVLSDNSGQFLVSLTFTCRS